MKRYYTGKTVGKYQMQRVMCIKNEDAIWSKDADPGCITEGVMIWRRGSKRSYHYGFVIIPNKTIDDFKTVKDVEQALAVVPGRFCGVRFMIDVLVSQKIIDASIPHRIHRCAVCEYDESNHDVLPEFNDYETETIKAE